MQKKIKFGVKDLEFDMDALDEEEKQIVRDMKAGNYNIVPISNARRRELEQAAKNTLKRLEKEKKEKNINIRLAERDLNSLKSKALKSGLPYQTLIGVLIRQYNDNKIEIKV
ncbi:MAG: antitoxin [Patescibacteria group bacterium]|nr:antitoxin [Patescibacteria group bacterium]